MGGAQKVKTEKPDVDLKSMSPLSTYGRDEQYIMNKLWLDGISSLILDGVGDGMINWCAIQKRIPIMCLYDKELHKRTIETHLLEKIVKKMEDATPKDTRWYRTNAQLGCRDGEEDDSARAKAKAKSAAAKAKAQGKRPREDPEPKAEEESASSSSSSSKKPKPEEKKND
jgi:hypothetical protein